MANKEENTLEKNLRKPEILEVLRKLQPTHHACMESDRYCQIQPMMVTQWHADEFGIVVHFHSKICVIGPDFSDCREIPYDSSDFPCPTYYSQFLHVTKDVIVVENRRALYTGSVAVFNRNTLEKVYTRPVDIVHLFVGLENGNRQLFLKHDDKHRMANVYKVHENGRLERVWRSREILWCHSEDCHRDRRQMIHIVEQTVVRYCQFCATGSILDKGHEGEYELEIDPGIRCR